MQDEPEGMQFSELRTAASDFVTACIAYAAQLLINGLAWISLHLADQHDRTMGGKDA